MPTYDYQCQACGHEFEQFQSMTANSLRKCPECGKLKLKRLIGTGAGVIFKGSGFYETDYRSEGYKKQAKAEQDKAEGKSDKADKSQSKSDAADAKSDSKPDAAKDTAKPAAPSSKKPEK